MFASRAVSTSRLFAGDRERRSDTTVATMMRAAVALLVSISLLGCFPHNPRARTYAKAGEGASILAGIAISALAGTGADCDEMTMAGIDNSSCHTKAKWLTTTGVVLIVGGLLGFVATVSTAEEEPAPKPLEMKSETVTPTAKVASPTAAPAADTSGTADPSAVGSAAPTAPQP